MKLKYVKPFRPGQNDIVVLTSKGAFKWSKLKESQEVPDDVGHEIMASKPGCFEVAAAPKKKAPPAENKMVQAPENKSAEE